LRRPSACAFAFEPRSARVAADAALHAIVGIAAKPIVVALPGMSIRLEHLVCLRRSTLDRCARPLSGRRWGWVVRHEAAVNGVMRTVEAVDLVAVIGGGRLRGLGGSHDRRRQRCGASERDDCRCLHFALLRASARG
jgi:hypothetical protein